MPGWAHEGAATGGKEPRNASRRGSARPFTLRYSVPSLRTTSATISTPAPQPGLCGPLRQCSPACQLPPAPPAALPLTPAAARFLARSSTADSNRRPRGSLNPSERHVEHQRSARRHSEAEEASSWASWAVANVTLEACSRWVSGIPVEAAAPRAAVIPGTMAKGIPRRAASASSPPRPNTRGSPPFTADNLVAVEGARDHNGMNSGVVVTAALRASADGESLRTPGD